MWISLNYDLLKSWKMIVGITVIFEVIFQSIVYLHPENLEWINSEQFSLSNTLQFIFIDQLLIECLTVSILFFLLRKYATLLSFTGLPLTPRGVVLYEIKFLPVFIIAFFIFAPITLTVRFLYHQFPNPDWAEYWLEYSYSLENYFNYLPAVILIGYTGLNINLLSQYNQQLNETKLDLHSAKKPKITKRIWAADEFGELFLKPEDIQWIERQDRKTIAVSGNEKYRLKESITVLDQMLDPDQFVRINRSTIVNLSQIDNYAYWENDKYVLRLKGIKEHFIMSRQRLKKIKEKLMLKDQHD